MLFNRTATVIIYPKGGGNGFDLTGLSIAFTIEKDVTPSPNRSSITIRNLSEQTRAKIREHQSSLILRVGYEDDVQAVIFKGDVGNVVHAVMPPEVTTTISTGDGQKAMRETKLSLSLEPGCSVGQACRVVAQRMGVEFDDFAGSGETLPGGFAFSGTPDSALRQLAATAGAEYSILDGRLQLLSDGGLRPGEAFLISPETGLIGSPERVVEQEGKLNKKVPRVQWTFRCLLNPRLQPGARVQLQSRQANGVFRIEKLRHTGDTHGDPWFSECQVSAK